MADFRTFDSRGYPIVGVREGYGEWVATYEDSVEDAMDLDLLAALTVVEWPAVVRAVDLGCGTGRTAAWLRSRGVGAIDGVDVTPEMLDRARARGAHDRLVEADVTATDLPDGAYDLAVCCLVDEHLADLRPLYAEAARLLRPGGALVVVGLHPHFFMATGMPTHFHRDDGEAVALTTYVHRFSDHTAAALGAGLVLAELRERVVDDAWIALKPRWDRWRDHPVSYAFAWRHNGPK